jgi:hypothetical protein
MTFDLAAHLRDGLRNAHWQNSDLWIATIAIGGNLNIREITDITSGDRKPSAIQYQTIAAALNEQLSDIGQNHPIRSWNDWLVDEPNRSTC